MDYNNQNNQQDGNPYGTPQQMPPNSYYKPRRPSNGLVTAAFALGIAAIVSAVMMTVYFPFILGGISIVLALLSKGYEKKMAGPAKIGIVCSIVGLILDLFIVGGSTYFVFTNEAAYNQFNSMYESIYGESFSDMYKEITGEEFYFD